MALDCSRAVRNSYTTDYSLLTVGRNAHKMIAEGGPPSNTECRSEIFRPKRGFIFSRVNGMQKRKMPSTLSGAVRYQCVRHKSDSPREEVRVLHTEKMDQPCHQPQICILLQRTPGYKVFPSYFMGVSSPMCRKMLLRLQEEHMTVIHGALCSCHIHQENHADRLLGSWEVSSPRVSGEMSRDGSGKREKWRDSTLQSTETGLQLNRLKDSA